MANDALSQAQVREVQQIAELETRRYFDHYLREVWPAQQAALREHIDVMIRQHDDSDVAHGGTERKVHRFIWVLLGMAAAGGAGGAGLMRLLMIFA